MKKLIKGIINFRQCKKDGYCEKYAFLADMQTPDALFIACCDSRVVPNVFASTDPGDLFVLRNIGNIVPPYQVLGSTETSVAAAVEYALLELKVNDIIVCGHSGCGAMKAILEQQQVHPSISSWVNIARHSYEQFLSENIGIGEHLSPVDQLSQINVLQQLEHLKSYPSVSEQLKQGVLTIHGWWFDLKTADVFQYSSTENRFILIDEESLQS